MSARGGELISRVALAEERGGQPLSAVEASVEDELRRMLSSAEPELWLPAFERTLTTPEEPPGFLEASKSPETAPDEGLRPSDMPAERRRELRHDLSRHAVAVTVRGDPDSVASQGKLRDLSLSGGLYVETAAPLPFRTDVRVELFLEDGRSMTFAGRVVRKPEPTGMAIQLKIDAVGREILEQVVATVQRSGPPRSTSDPAASPVPTGISLVIRPDDASRQSSDGLAVDESAMSRAWRDVVDRFEEDRAHQAFIEICLVGQRIDYALERYRSLKATRPDDPLVDRYLAQVGTILGFCVLNKPSAPEEKRSWFRAPFKVLTVGLVLVAALLLALSMRVR